MSPRFSFSAKHSFGAKPGRIGRGGTGSWSWQIRKGPGFGITPPRARPCSSGRAAEGGRGRAPARGQARPRHAKQDAHALHPRPCWGPGFLLRVSGRARRALRVTLAACPGRTRGRARSGPALPAPRRGFRRPALRLSLGPKMFRAHRLDARSGGLSVGGVRWGGVTQSRGDVKWRTRAEGAGGSGPSRLLRAVFAQRRGRL